MAAPGGSVPLSYLIEINEITGSLVEIVKHLSSIADGVENPSLRETLSSEVVRLGDQVERIGSATKRSLS